MRRAIHDGTSDRSDGEGFVFEGLNILSGARGRAGVDAGSARGRSASAEYRIGCCVASLLRGVRPTRELARTRDRLRRAARGRDRAGTGSDTPRRHTPPRLDHLGTAAGTHLRDPPAHLPAVPRRDAPDRLPHRTTLDPRDPRPPRGSHYPTAAHAAGARPARARRRVRVRVRSIPDLGSNRAAARSGIPLRSDTRLIAPASVASRSAVPAPCITNHGEITRRRTSRQPAQILSPPRRPPLPPRRAPPPPPHAPCHAPR